MAENGRQVAVAIGVSEAKPLPYLGGAVNGARAFHKWAARLGYESRLVTDEDQPVTLAWLRSELEAALKPLGQPIHRLLIYFAGHGLIREAEEGLWLLSDWNAELKAVGVEVLRRRLYMHNIQQLAIFADSCRELPPNVIVADLTVDGVLGRGPVPEPKPPAIDKFIAAQDGRAAFMVPGKNPEEDRCLFSGVLIEGLWGTRPEAFSKVLKDKITSRSLGAFLNAEVPKVAASYKRELIPSVSPTFPEGDDIYFGEGKPPTPPDLPPWPSPDDVARMTAAIEQGLAERFDTALGGSLGRKVSYVETEGFEVGGGGGEDEAESEDEEVGDIGGVSEPQRKSGEGTFVKPSILQQLRSQPRPAAFQTGAGFAVEGEFIQSFWVAVEVLAASHGGPNWWQLHHRQHPQLLKSEPILIQFKDGMFAALAALPGFIGTVLCQGPSISALIYRLQGEERNSAAAAESAISQMESGALRADAAADLAVGLRKMKHVDPVLGVISAYLYDSIGDIDNIRRMAFYYVQHNQPIPFDIALLGQLKGEWRDGTLWAQVPMVSKRKPGTKAERQNLWTYSATPPTFGKVGGYWPWMRQGWAFLDDSASTLMRPGLTELRPHLIPSRFTMLDADGGKKLAKIFGLADREHPTQKKSRPARLAGKTAKKPRSRRH